MPSRAPRSRPLVVDPVMVAKSGDRLLDPDAVVALRDRLLPLADADHAEPAGGGRPAWTGRRRPTRESMARAAADLATLGPRAVLIKGGHLADGPAVDLLWQDGRGARVRGAAAGHPQHPRHRLHPVGRDRRPHPDPPPRRGGRARPRTTSTARSRRPTACRSAPGTDRPTISTPSGPHRSPELPDDRFHRSRQPTPMPGLRRAIHELPVQPVPGRRQPAAGDLPVLYRPGFPLPRRLRARAGGRGGQGAGPGCHDDLRRQRPGRPWRWSAGCTGSIFAQFGLDPAVAAATEPSPTCLGYTSYLLSLAQTGGFAELVAGILPCFTVYAEVRHGNRQKGFLRQPLPRLDRHLCRSDLRRCRPPPPPRSPDPRGGDRRPGDAGGHAPGLPALDPVRVAVLGFRPGGREAWPAAA